MVFAVCALLALVAMVYVLYVQPDSTPAPASDPQLDYLLEKKAVLYENLRDLNLEFRMGKLSDEDYQRLKHQCQFEIGGVMAQIESHPPSASTLPAPIYRGAVERRAPSPPPTHERMCPRCGAANSSRNSFCGECGKKLVPLSGIAQESEQ